MRTSHLLLTLFMVLAAVPTVHAQYKWRDTNGRLVYSDLPPPASVAPRDVLQSPARSTPASAVAGSGDAANVSTASAASSATPVATASAPLATNAAAAPVTSADRELDFRKRRQERLDAEAKQAQDTQRARQSASACAEAREGLRTLESGLPVSSVNARGEPQLLDDAQRVGRIGNLRRVMQESCRS